MLNFDGFAIGDRHAQWLNVGPGPIEFKSIRVAHVVQLGVLLVDDVLESALLVRVDVFQAISEDGFNSLVLFVADIIFIPFAISPLLILLDFTVEKF